MLLPEVEAAIRKVIDQADLQDLSCNRIRELLVPQFGRQYLSANYEDLRAFIKDYLLRDVTPEGVENEVVKTINQAKSEKRKSEFRV